MRAKAEPGRAEAGRDGNSRAHAAASSGAPYSESSKASINWTRPPREVSALMRVLALALKNEVQNFHKNNIRLLHIGRLDPLPKTLQKQVRESLGLLQAYFAGAVSTR